MALELMVYYNIFHINDTISSNKGFTMKKRLTIIQMDVHVNDVEYNYTRVQELLSQSLSENPDIIVLPETWNTGFYPSKS